MAQTRNVRGVATTVRTDADGCTRVRYHQTDVVTFNASEAILQTGGWYTATTKTRMNQAACEYNLGFRVFQRKGDWFVHFLADGSERPFENGMTVPVNRVAWDGERWGAVQ